MFKLQIHKTFLQELLNDRDELIKIKHELEFKKQEDTQLEAIKQELQTLKDQINLKEISNDDGDGLIEKMLDIARKIFTSNAKKKGAVILVLVRILKAFFAKVSDIRKPKWASKKNLLFNTISKLTYDKKLLQLAKQ